ncbi:MAG: Gfo/Idh/MocA family oxidoreductase [Bryobacterales bacterium]|nr:Gfo/Idh/MocA family oxidoreductase [Bryobacterales bacterium]
MSAPRQPVRFGVIGCGVIAYWSHLRELPHVPGARLAAAADPDPAARQNASLLTRIAVHADPGELLARSDIDAVIISAPTHLHASLAVAAAQAGKHVYVEKPLAITAAEAAQAAGAVRGAGVAGAVGFNRRCHPLFEQARAMLDSGVIGPVHAVQSSFCEPIAEEAMPRWKRTRATGGGVLLDLASHHIDLLRWFFRDEIAGVHARLASRRTEHDHAWLDVTLRGGIEARGFFSFQAARADFLEFYGERGVLRVDRHRPRLSLRTSRRLGYGVRSAMVAPSRDVAAWWLRRLTRPSWEPSYRRALAAFVEMISGAPPRLALLDDGLRNVEAILAAEAAARPA